MQGDRAHRAPLVLVPPDELTCKVLGLRGAAAVPDGEQPPAAQQGAGKPPAPRFDPVEIAGEAVEGAHERREVLMPDPFVNRAGRDHPTWAADTSRRREAA